MTIADLPQFIRSHYEVYESKHATAILQQDFPDELQDIMEVLSKFRLRKKDLVVPGGSKTKIANYIDEAFIARGWEERGFETKVVVDQEEFESPTHKVDCFKNHVAIEIEWNNKDPFFDRDLNNFRLLFDLRTVSVGVIITRCDELQKIFNKLGRGPSYGASTTHMGKLLPRMEGGGGGGCPVLVFGITSKLYEED